MAPPQSLSPKEAANPSTKQKIKNILLYIFLSFMNLVVNKSMGFPDRFSQK